MESGFGAVPDFKCWRATVNSLCKKLSEILTGSGAVAPKGQTFIGKQLEMTCGKQPRIFYF